MTKLERINARIEDNEELKKAIENRNYTDCEDFIRNAERYIKAIKEGRVIVNIDSVSSSGMSRTVKFLECNGSKKNGYQYYNFFMLFDLLGFTSVKHSDYFRINGCGMDMIYHTNYTIVHKLYKLGFINKKDCEYLAEKTPSVI